MYERVTATFRPQRADDLKPEAKAAIGWRGTWRAAWVIEDGPYKGQTAYEPDAPQWFGWVPGCDLADIEPPLPPHEAENREV